MLFRLIINTYFTVQSGNNSLTTTVISLRSEYLIILYLKALNESLQ